MNATAAQTGLRKDEVASKTVAEGLTSTKVQFNRASVVFSVGGTMHADPDPQVLRMFGESDGVILKPRPSKADQFGAFWCTCDKPIFLPYRNCKHNKVCAARELTSGTRVNVSSTWGQATHSAFVCSRQWQALL